MKPKTFICSVVAGVMALTCSALAKYDCTSTKAIVGASYSQVSFKGAPLTHNKEDLDGDLKADRVRVYFFDGCQKLLRTYPVGSENKEQKWVNDFTALEEYVREAK